MNWVEIAMLGIALLQAVFMPVIAYGLKQLSEIKRDQNETNIKIRVLEKLHEKQTENEGRQLRDIKEMLSELTREMVAFKDKVNQEITDIKVKIGE